MKIIREKSVTDYTDSEIDAMEAHKAEFEKKFRDLEYKVDRIIGRGKIILFWEKTRKALNLIEDFCRKNNAELD